MSGLEEILNIIGSQQKENENAIMSDAESKVREIEKEAEEKAEKAYSDYMKRASAKNARDYENACASVDSEMKRAVLEFKVGQLDNVFTEVMKKLNSLPADEYFSMLGRLIKKHLRSGSGVISLSRRDLDRLPNDFEQEISNAAVSAGGTAVISPESADIDDGFILRYGNISENCTFAAILDAEHDAVRDLAAKELFG